MGATEHDGGGRGLYHDAKAYRRHDQIVIRVPQPNSTINWTAAPVHPIQLMCSPFNLYTFGSRRSLGVYV